MITIVIAAIMGYVNLGILCGLGAYYEERSKLAGWLVFLFWIAAPFLIAALLGSGAKHS
jgi:hypothetical protein